MIDLFKRAKNNFQVWCIEFTDKYFSEAKEKSVLESHMGDIKRLLTSPTPIKHMEKVESFALKIPTSLRGAFLARVTLGLEHGYTIDYALNDSFNVFGKNNDERDNGH